MLMIFLCTYFDYEIDAEAFKAILNWIQKKLNGIVRNIL